MKKILGLILLMSLILGLSVTRNSSAASGSYLDVEISKFSAALYMDKDGQPMISIYALMVNKGSLVAENCETKFKMNGKELTTKIYKKIENGYPYIFQGSYLAEKKNERNEIILSACPALPGEKNKSNNEKKTYVTAKTTNAITVGSGADLAFKKYDIIAGRNEENKDVTFITMTVSNSANVASGPFNVMQTINNSAKSSITFDSVPGKSEEVYSSVTSGAFFGEGNNLIDLNIDPENTIKETNEKNNQGFWMVVIEDGEVAKLSKISKQPNFIVQGLFYVNPLLLNSNPSSGSSGIGAAVSIPITNVWKDFASTEKHELKVDIQLYSTLYSQTFPVAGWPVGTKQVFTFTSHLFKKKEMKSSLQVKTYWDGAKIDSTSMKVTCF